jgi:DNA repair photolyase
MHVVEIMAKSIITKSNLPDADYVVNPYTGCAFACGYCYASFMGRFIGEAIENWGNYVYIKRNAVHLFESELSKFSPQRRNSSILISSVTDAWQGHEKKYRLARGILQVLVRAKYPGTVSILTKSPLVLDDLITIRQLPSPDVGVTITSTDDEVSRIFEANAPSASARIRILEEFNRAGIPTYAFVGPLFPHFGLMPEKIDELFGNIAKVGTRSVYVEQLNLSPYIRRRLDAVMQLAAPTLVAAYAAADEAETRRRLAETVRHFAERHALNVRLGAVLDHRADGGSSRD